MAEFQLVRVVEGQLPVFDRMTKTFWSAVGKIIIASILTNILTQKQADGSDIKRNATSTLERKRKLGRGQRSLVDALHRFVNPRKWRAKLIEPSEYKRVGAGGVEVFPRGEELKKLNRYVQQKGYTGYLGISKEAAAKIKLELRDEIRRQFRGANR